MMKKKIVLGFFLCFLLSTTSAQEKKVFKIMWYNVENFFDCVDDPHTNDNEFLPDAKHGWTYSRYQKKQEDIARVITAIGGWEAPALVGMCEVENEKCLTDLTRYSGLKNFHYRFLHHESPDPRGIDVALLYQPSQFRPFHDEAIRIKYPTGGHTRDILFASGRLPSGDTLHVFVCHFPSRLGGETESEKRRMFVASVVRGKVDSLFSASACPNILIMGDFNDYPTNKSLLETLNAKPLSSDPVCKNLYNLMYQMQKNGKGTNKYKGEWGVLDQMIVSGALLRTANHLHTTQNNAHIFDAGFLLEDDVKYLGKQPFRTYVGMKYHEGFSDHLPVYADFLY